MHTLASEAPSRLLVRLGSLAIAAMLGASAMLLAAPAAPAHAHDQLIGSQLETTEAGEVTGLKLSFSDNVLQVGTEIIVTDSNDKSIVNGSPKFAGRDVVQPLESPLPDGRYTSVWRVVSSDGHPIEGGFAFDITDGVAGEMLPLDATGEQPDATDDKTAEGEQTTPPGNPAADSPDSLNFAIFLPFIGVGVGLAAIIVIAAVIVRGRKNAATRDTSQHSPEQD